MDEISSQTEVTDNKEIKVAMLTDRQYGCSHGALKDEDLQLWNSFRDGSKEAFEKIYCDNIDNLYNYAILIFKDKAIVEDAIQDMFIDLWRRKASLGETTSIDFYLRKALKRNIARKLATKERLTFPHQLPDEYTIQITNSAETEIILPQLAYETSEVLIRTIKTLPARQQKILMYKFYDNLSSQEISHLMSICQDSVYTLISRALKNLKSRIKASQLTWALLLLLSF